ncbi:MAG: hypothetical protein QOK05_1412 [Chloroflexota bacterium]|jgi:uncharacterized protein YggT (Ycf19 family)|nr:hypothetical protein [Chloroflexota bacterium]
MTNEVQVPVVTERAVVETSVVEPATHNFRAVQAIWLVTSVITTLIAIRFVLKVLGASLQSGFVTLLYSLTDGLVGPFQAIFPRASSQGSTVDMAALVAIVIYALVGLGLVSATKLLTTPRGARSVS